MTSCYTTSWDLTGPVCQRQQHSAGAWGRAYYAESRCLKRGTRSSGPVSRPQHANGSSASLAQIIQGCTTRGGRLVVAGCRSGLGHFADHAVSDAGRSPFLAGGVDTCRWRWRRGRRLGCPPQRSRVPHPAAVSRWPSRRGYALRHDPCIVQARSRRRTSRPGASCSAKCHRQHDGKAPVDDCEGEERAPSRARAPLDRATVIGHPEQQEVAVANLEDAVAPARQFHDCARLGDPRRPRDAPRSGSSLAPRHRRTMRLRPAALGSLPRSMPRAEEALP